jgi:hypothetical protein
MATMMGTLLARRALGASVEEIGFPVTPLAPMPLHAFSRPVARATIQYLRGIDALSRVRARLRSGAIFRA